MRRLVTCTAVALAWLAAIVFSALPPRGQPLPNADRMEQIIHLGLFPDKPRSMSFREYFSNFTDLNENLTKAIERLEFGVLDSENLEIAIKLAEDAKRFKELAAAGHSIGRRNWKPALPQNEVFNYKNFSWTWQYNRRLKLFQFMQHSIYSTRYEISKLHNLRMRYNQSAVYKIGVIYGNNLEIKTIAGMLFVTMQRMPPNVTMLWYVFHYTKLLNMAYDMESNVEYAYVMNQRLKDGRVHMASMQEMARFYSMPLDSNELTSMDPRHPY